MRNFEKGNKEKLIYARKVCKRGHVGPNNKTVRYIERGCWACLCGLPDGAFTFDFGDLPEQEYKHKKKYATEEEARQAHVARQVEWNRNHREVYREAQKRYHSKPEVAAKRAAAYMSRTEEEREQIRIRQREYYARNKEARQAANKQRYEENKETILAKQREKYHASKEQE